MEEYEVRERYRRETYPSHDIVRAWFDDAINPTIDLLQREAVLLSEESWTWDHRNGLFRGLSTISDSSSFSANEEDFLSRHSHIEEALIEHDDSLTMLNTEGYKLFEAVAGSPFLLDAYSRACSPDALNRIKPDLRFGSANTPEEILNEVFGSHSPEIETLAWLAESSINSIRSLPHDNRQAFWRANRASFLQVVQYPPLSEFRALVAQAREDLALRIQELIGMLKKTRRELSERHGVPVESRRPILESDYSGLAVGHKRYY